MRVKIWLVYIMFKQIVYIMFTSLTCLRLFMFDLKTCLILIRHFEKNFQLIQSFLVLLDLLLLPETRAAARKERTHSGISPTSSVMGAPDQRSKHFGRSPNCCKDMRTTRWYSSYLDLIYSCLYIMYVYYVYIYSGQTDRTGMTTMIYGSCHIHPYPSDIWLNTR